MYKRLSLALMAAGCANGAVADSAGIEEVVIWGAEVKASSLKLDAEKIALKQADHISDLLRIIPGADVGGAHSLNQRITLRSMDDKDLRISIDGANQNTYMYHHMGNLQIHADILKSVDIDVGNNSVINGGLGGVVRFETRDAAELLKKGNQFGGRVHLSSSNNASSNFSLANYGQVTEDVDFLAYYNAVDRDNYSVGGGKILDQNGDEVPGTDGDVKGLKGELDDLLLKVGWTISDNQRLKFGYESYKDEGDYSYRPDMGLATDSAIADALDVPIVYPTEFTRDTYTLNYSLMLDNTSVKTSIFRNESDLWRDERGLASWRPPAATINEGVADNTGLTIIAATEIISGVEQELTYGLDLIQHETSFSNDGIEAGSEESKVSAVYVQDRISVTNILTVIPGIRYESVDLKAALVDATFSKPTGALAVELQVNDGLLFVLSATEIFKAPELSEVFTGAGAYDLPNPDIEAEEGHNLQASVAIGSGGFDAGLTLFQTKIEDYIYDYNPAAGRQYLKDNVGHMTVDGAELYVGYTASQWDILATYSVAESDLEAFSEYASLDGARIDREQGDTFTLSGSYTFSDINLTLHWDTQSVGSLEDGLALDGASEDTSKDSFVMHNISVRWLPEQLEGLAVTLGVDNLSDEFYASQSSRTGLSNHPLFGPLYLLDYEPGRNVKASLSYQF